MRAYTYVLLLSMLCCPDLYAQDLTGRQAAVQEFQREHPRALLSGAKFNQADGIRDEARTATTISGTSLAIGDTPVASAWNHVAEVLPMLADEMGDLVPAIRPDGEITTGAMFDRDSQTYGFSTFRFEQVYNNVPVFRSGAGFLVRNDESNSLVMSTFDIKDLSGLSQNVGIDPDPRAYSSAMIAASQGLFDEQLIERGLPLSDRPARIETSEEEMVLWAGVNDTLARPELAIKFVATRGSARVAAELFQRHLILISVATDEILLSEDMVHNFTDVTGTITGNATNGPGALECHPETAVPMPYAEANVVGGNSTFADANGQFVIPHGGTTAVTVRSRVRGQYFEIFDDTTGQSIPELTTVVTPPGPANFLHNPGPSVEFKNSAVNAYVEANRVRDFVLNYAPNYPVIDTETFFDIVVNEDNFSGITSCNAVYTGSSMVFWRNAGGCNNSAFSDVVHHEYGHHLISVTGNGQGQLGEGSGDCMGVLIQDDPSLGDGLATCGVGIRNADNSHQYPCNGAIHDCGQLISGCVWSLRNELIVTEPASYLDIGASLFVNMLIVRGQMFPGNSTIDPAITIIYLELDDDDADIGNGTPHYQEIASAFGDHNMDAPMLDFIRFDFPDGQPETVNPTGGVVEFRVAVTGVIDTPVADTGVLFVDRGAGIEMFPMNEESPNVYEVVFPTIDCGAFTYYFSADSNSNGTILEPTGAPSTSYEALAATSIIPTFDDDFEANMGWSVSGNATAGVWQRGTPAGAGDRGDPTVDGDGSGQCYLTENGAGNTDVDGGSTILLSPIMDGGAAGPGQTAVISYHRWYHNTFGGAPAADIFVVDISNDGGSSWVNLETVGPSGPEVSGGWIAKQFAIEDFLPTTSNMRVRFTASDLATGSVVEAAVDGVQIVTIDCDQAGAVQYCATSPNSAGAGAVISSSGSVSVGANNLVLVSGGAIPNGSGLFYFGPNMIQAPFGDGLRCIGGATRRLFPIITADGMGTATRPLDFTAPPMDSGTHMITPGSTWNFQHWFRDNAAGMSGFNLSNGLSVTFAP